MAANKLSTMAETGAITGAERIEVLQDGQNKAMTLTNGPNKIPVLNAGGYLPVTILDPYLQLAINTHGARLDDLEGIDADSRLVALEAAQAGSMIGFTTKALMDADLAHDAGVLARVTNDDVDPANNGVYIKLGATGAGSWQQSDDEISILAGQVAEVGANVDALGVRVTDLEDSGAAELPVLLDDAGMRKAIPAGTKHPIVVDQDRRQLLYYDEAGAKFYVHGMTEPLDLLGDLRGDLDAAGCRRFLGDGPIYPLLVDASNRVLLGYDADSNRLVGLALGSGSNTNFPVPAAINGLLLYGQSLSLGTKGTPILSTTQPYNNLTFNGGPRAAAGDFSSFKPLVEDALTAPDGGTDRGETPCSGAANYATRLAALENGILPAEHVILASAPGHGAYSITDLNKASPWYIKLEAHVSNAVALNPDCAYHAVGYVQGENDTLSTGGMPFGTYRGYFSQLQVDIEATVKAFTGQSSPVWMLTYQTAARVANWPDVALAQLDLCQKNSRFALTTPIYHMPVTVGDGVHLTNVGYKWLGAYIGRAYKQLVHDQRKPDWLNPISATRTGAEIRVRFGVPTLPLVLDTATLAVTTNHGFRVVDSVGTVTISSVTVVGNEIVLALAATPTGATVVRYALDYLGAGLIIEHGASGNLRDSTPETVVIAGVTKPMYHVCPHFQLDVVDHKDI